MWCIADLNEEYIERMEDVLGTYEKPFSARAPVVCMDEKPVVLHADVRNPIPMQPGRVARRDCEYQRRGTANAFCAVEPKAGVHFIKITPTRSSPKFADFLFSIAEQYPAADTIHLVMDNLSTHTRKAVVDRLMAVGSIHYPLHAKARQLAEPGRDRDQPALPPMSGKTEDR